MENYENIPENQIPEPSAPKASPFADSPYVMEHQAAPVAPAKPKKAKGKWGKSLLFGFFVVCLVAFSCVATGLVVTRYWNGQARQIIQGFHLQIAELNTKIEDNSFTGQGNSISGPPGAVEGLTPGQVYAQNKKSVVAISNQGVTANIFGQITETASSGSGFIISEDGYIVTNYHVIADAKTLTVITTDGKEYPASVVGYDDGNDFALIKIEATDLPTVTLGSSDDLIVGDQVAAIGNPLGELTNSLSVGVISAKDRDVSTDSSIINMLQTDAAINPGNSGGPLFNMKGEVIGITTAKYSGTTSSGASIEGIGFAIPIDDVKEMITELIEDGYISAPYMGISINNQRDGVGVLVIEVTASSPAAVAGIQVNDIIVGLGEYETKTLAELDRALRKFEPNDTTSVFVYRNRQVLELTITFGSKNTAPTTP